MESIITRVKEYFEQGLLSQMPEACFPIPCGFMGSAEWEECREYLEQIPEEERRGSAHYCVLMTLDAIQRGDMKQVRHWHSALISLRDATKEDSEKRQQLDYVVSWVTAQIPQADNGQLLLTMAILYNAALSNSQSCGYLSATMGTPSVLRGTKDLSEWGKNYRAVNSIVKPMLAVLMDGQGEGVSEVAIAELAYEKNHMNEASVAIAGALTTAVPEMHFAGYAQLARISRFAPGARSAHEILQGIGTYLEDIPQNTLKDNYKAVCARFDMEEGNLEAVHIWLESREASIVCNSPAQIFQMTTQAKAYIAMGYFRDALTLLEQITHVMREDFRPLDVAECLANSAVACICLGENAMAKEKLEKALEITRPYGYIRVYADLGSLMLKALDLLDSREDSYLQEIYTATEEFSEKYPLLYQQPKEEKPAEPEEEPLPKLVEELTKTELTVLELISKGKTNSDIAGIMKTKVTTVKYHVKNIFGKLGAKNRTEAVNFAKMYKLIE